MFRKTLLAALAGSAFASAGMAYADTGFYVGGSVGQAKVEDSERFPNGTGFTKLDFDEDDTGYKLFAGFMILPFLGVEGGYVNFGEPEKSFLNGQAHINAQIDGWEGFAVGVLPLGPLDLFAKAGVLAYDADVKVRANGSTLISGSNSDESAAYGVGAAVGLGGLKVRAEYTYYDVEDVDDVYMISAGVTYHF